MVERSAPASCPDLARPAVATLALALGLLLALLAAAPAAASHHEFRFGVIEDTIDPRTDIAAMDRANVRSLRFRFSWVKIEREPPTGGVCATARYEWGEYDRVVARASVERVRLLAVIAGSPRYVWSRPTGSREAPDTRLRREIEPYKCFVRALVARYGRGGTFAGRPGRPAPIKDWQVWNEPNIRSFTPRGVVEPREYARLVKATSTIIRGRDRQATILLAGMPELKSPSASIHRFLPRFYREPRIRRRFDAVAIHPYARNAAGVEGALTRLRGTLRRLSDARRVAWVTEVGWATRGSGLPFVRKTEKGQARELRKTLRMLRSNRSRFRLGTVHWFRWRDVKSYSQRGGVFDFAGLFRRNGTPKPSCDAFARITGGLRCAPIPRPRGAATVSSTSGDRGSAAAAITPSAPE